MNQALPLALEACAGYLARDPLPYSFGLLGQIADHLFQAKMLKGDVVDNLCKKGRERGEENNESKESSGINPKHVNVNISSLIPLLPPVKNK